MSYRIAICDDSPEDAGYVQKFVKAWSEAQGVPVHMEVFSSAEQFLFHYADNKDYDMALLDVEMGEMDGVSLAKKLRRDNETMQIIFITGYSDYISEGYEVAALHYLMKPVSGEKLFSVLDRAVQKLQKNEKVLTFEASGEMVRVPLYQIRYVDVQLNYITIHCRGEVTVKKSLGDMAKLLDDRFYRVGRSAIVNLTCIERVTKTEIHLQDGGVLPLPRGAYEGVNRAIIQMG